MVHNPKNSSKALLWCLESAIGLIHEAIIGKIGISSNGLRKYFRENTRSLDVSDRQISQMVYDLKRREYISFGEGDSVVLTNKAKIKIIDQVVRDERKDGKYRFISFDIPESKRLRRDNFRLAIKRMGFCQVQKSLWVCEYNLGDLVEAAIAEFEVDDYVAYFVADKTNIDDHIQKVLA